MCALHSTSARCRAFGILAAVAMAATLVACSGKSGEQTPADERRWQPPAPQLPDEAATEQPDPVLYRVPDALMRQRAIGVPMSPVLQRALHEQEGFVVKREPKPGEWLAEHDEPGQGFADYTSMRPNRPNADRGTIYLLPIGNLRSPSGSQTANPSMAVMADYVRAFFGVEVAVLPVVAVADVGATRRAGRGFGDIQLLSTDILTYLAGRLPDDAYALIALTMVDLYPDPSWNFVFGQASLRERVGVYSLARYQPGDGDVAGDAADARRLVMRRALKVMSHELGHMFGIVHCVYFECVMNGSNSLAETDGEPMHLCPVDLRKVLHITGMQPVERYRQLATFYQRHGLAEELAFVQMRVRVIEEASPP